MSYGVQRRDLVLMALLLVVTLGFYFIYWAVKTKHELCRMGAVIPTSWLVIIPVVNFYFWYKYVVAFTTFVKRGSDPIVYFLLMILLPIIGIFVIQNEFNKIAAQVN
jgi:hypothetical protein